MKKSSESRATPKTWKYVIWETLNNALVSQKKKDLLKKFCTTSKAIVLFLFLSVLQRMWRRLWPFWSCGFAVKSQMRCIPTPKTTMLTSARAEEMNNPNKLVNHQRQFHCLHQFAQTRCCAIFRNRVLRSAFSPPLCFTRCWWSHARMGEFTWDSILCSFYT